MYAIIICNRASVVSAINAYDVTKGTMDLVCSAVVQALFPSDASKKRSPTDSVLMMTIRKKPRCDCSRRG